MNISPKAKIVGLLAGIICYVLPLSDTVAQAYGSISFETFYHELAPYGNWVRNPQYGQVWIPNVERGFRPYQTRGHWVMTEYGNTWVSDYAWGWAPFHYGRWYLDDYYGWMWVPGSEWGPAWVAWRSGGGYYGWAPLGPGLHVSINIGRRIPRPYWTFVRQRYITSPRIYDYCVPRRQVVNVINHTTIINNTNVYNERHRYYSGPRTRDIERVTHRRVPVRRLQSSRRPGATSVRRKSVAIYRPTVRSRQGTSRSVAPTSGRSLRETNPRSTSRNNSPIRSSYDRVKQPTSPAVRSSRTRDNTIRNSDFQTAVPRRDVTRKSGSQPGTTRSMYDNRSRRSSTSTPSYRETSRSRAPAGSRVTPGRQRSSGSHQRYESRSEPNRSQTRTRSNSRSSTNSSSITRQPSPSPSRTRSSSGSSSPSYSRPSSPSRSPSSTRSSSPSVSRPSETRSAPAETRSRSTSPSPSSGRSSSGRSRSSRP